MYYLLFKDFMNEFKVGYIVVYRKFLVCLVCKMIVFGMVVCRVREVSNNVFLFFLIIKWLRYGN